jgi:hypothetical protein
MLVLGPSSEAEMIACFLGAELTSTRFGPVIQSALAANGHPESLLTHPDLSDTNENAARRALLALTRGYGEHRELFDGAFPAKVTWTRAVLTPAELAAVRYMDYSYWIELSGGTRLPTDAAKRIKAGHRAYDIPNDGAIAAGQAAKAAVRFTPLILVGETHDSLVCLEGHLRLTAYALAGFPAAVECLLGTAPDMGRWAH